mmetsp:Transcript_29305/g.93485  ORF Transcript_29305/g.93485 Transcript_29305/m.93485 type:complete len:239 (+) Transcript_29305:99-815(+)
MRAARVTPARTANSGRFQAPRDAPEELGAGDELRDGGAGELVVVLPLMFALPLMFTLPLMFADALPRTSAGARAVGLEVTVEISPSASGRSVSSPATSVLKAIVAFTRPAMACTMRKNRLLARSLAASAAACASWASAATLAAAAAAVAAASAASLCPTMSSWLSAPSRLPATAVTVALLAWPASLALAWTTCEAANHLFVASSALDSVTWYFMAAFSALAASSTASLAASAAAFMSQ